MPVQGVDTFSRLCIPDLECAISGAADDDVVSHLRWPHAPRVAHQRPQTLQHHRRRVTLLPWMLASKTVGVITFIHIQCWSSKSHLEFCSYRLHAAFRGEEKNKSEIKFVWTFIGRKISHILALAPEQNISAFPPRAFYNCFYLSVINTANLFLLQRRGLTAIFNKMHPFILIRDGRLAIDYSSYGNLSDQLNLRLHSLSQFNYPKCNKLKFSGGEEQTLAAAAVVLDSEWSVSF